MAVSSAFTVLPVSSSIQVNVDGKPIAQTMQRGAPGECSRAGPGRKSPLSAVAAAMAFSAALTRSQRVGKRFARITRKASEDIATVAVEEASTWDLWFEDYATWLIDHFDSQIGLKEMSLPPEFAARKGQSEATASAEIRTKLFAGKHEGSPIKKLRLTMVCNGSELQALNAVVYPAIELGPLPIWGIDLLSFSGGKRMLFGLDWAPMSRDKAYADKYITPYLKDIKDGKHAALASEPSSRIYGEDPEFFSPYMFFARPEGRDHVELGSGLWEVFKAYCFQYTKMLRNAAVEPSLEKHIQAAHQQAAYEKWHAERDPAILVFRRLFGADWTGNYVKGLLFPASAQTGDDESDPKLSPLELHRAGIFRSESSGCPFAQSQAPPNDFCKDNA